MAASEVSHGGGPTIHLAVGPTYRVQPAAGRRNARSTVDLLGAVGLSLQPNAAAHCTQWNRAAGRGLYSHLG